MTPKEHHDSRGGALGQQEALHKSGRSPWLRAAVLGANDGLISTASLIVGVAAAGSTRSSILVAGFAGLSAGALSMAAGEYVSVASQRDAETADLARERWELAESPAAERRELEQIYVDRGLRPALAAQVAEELSAHDVERVHARDELGIDLDKLANPLQAAVTSALSFVAGAAVPIVATLIAPAQLRAILIIAITVVSLVVLGATSAVLGGAGKARAVRRVVIGGLLALLISLVVGRLTGAAV